MTKMRVRELSAELGLSNKDMLHMLRENNIPVKSHMSGLSEDQVEQIRQRFRSGSSRDYSQSRVTSSGVIVRRRRRGKTQDKESAEKAPSDDQAEAQAEAEAPAEAETRTEAAEEARAEEPEPSEAEPVPSGETAGQQEQEEASAPEEAAPVQEPEQTPEEPAPEAKQEQAQSAQESEEAPRKKRKKRSRKKAQEPEQPTVTVISRPEVEEPPTGEPAPEEPVKAKGAPAGEAESAPGKKPSKPGKKKGKRTVDVSGLYDEQEEAQEPAEEKKEKPKGKKAKPGKKQPGRKKAAPGKPEKERSGKSAGGVAAAARPQKAAKRKIKVEEGIKVSELAQEMGVKAQAILKGLMDLGVMATINQTLDLDTAAVLAEEYGYEVERTGFSEEAYLPPQEEDSPEKLQSRPPVVTIMGHVDHGKTSLLDGIRESHVMDREAGGITQHIGAYSVNLRDNTIVFLDTPGHEAFTEMRSRGAQVTDIVVLIVAADDGVMDQTREAINHAQAAEVPILVAVNKVDKDNADLDRVRRELAEQGLISEEWGGETIFTYISAKQRQGIDQVLEMILLQSEMLQLQANPDKPARGHIVESRLDKGKGPVGTVLIQEGTLRTGDAVVCGLHYGRMRALFNDRGEKIHSAGPSTPVEVQGLEDVPQAGDEFVVVEEEKVAKRIAEERKQKQREKELAQEGKLTLESFFQAKQEEEQKTLNLVLKADVHGSLEAATESINKLSTEEVRVNIIHGGIGGITESDIKLATASDAVLIGFNVRPTAKIRDLAEKEGVDIRFYSIIYELVDEVKEAMAGMLAPVTREVYLGQAEVRETFNIPRVGTVAGCYILDGKLQRHANVRLLREGVVIHTGRLDTLKRFKENAKEVSKGYECGASLANYNDIKNGDIIEAYSEVQEQPSLE